MMAAALLVIALPKPCLGTLPGFPPSLRPGCLPADPRNTDIYCPGDLDYGCYKIPTILRTVNGTLLAMIEARKFSCDDHGYVDLRLRRSFDQGRTWGPSLLMYSASTKSRWTTVGDGNWVQDSVSGVISLFHTRNNTELFLSHSNDEGASWSKPVSVPFLKNKGQSVGTGHAGGIQLSTGPTKGRLIVPIYSAGPYALYSDDRGLTWRRGSNVPGETYVDGSSAGEWAVAETGSFTADGVPILLATVRNSPHLPSPITGKGFRLQVRMKL